jgi:hypothetical protein
MVRRNYAGPRFSPHLEGHGGVDLVPNADLVESDQFR